MWHLTLIEVALWSLSNVPFQRQHRACTLKHRLNATRSAKRRSLGIRPFHMEQLSASGTKQLVDRARRVCMNLSTKLNFEVGEPRQQVSDPISRTFPEQGELPLPRNVERQWPKFTASAGPQSPMPAHRGARTSKPFIISTKFSGKNVQLHAMTNDKRKWRISRRNNAVARAGIRQMVLVSGSASKIGLGE